MSSIPSSSNSAPSCCLSVEASIRSFEWMPSAGAAWANWSATIPSRTIKSSGIETFWSSTSNSAPRSFALWLGPVATILFRNIICPAPQSPRAVFLAWAGYLCLEATIAKLWKPVSSGKKTLQTSLCWNCRTGRNAAPIASPRYPSSIGGLPTMVIGSTASLRWVIAVTWSTGNCPSSE